MNNPKKGLAFKWTGVSSSIFFLLLTLTLSGSSPSNENWEVVEAFPGLLFRDPVDLTTAPGDARHLFVVEQRGRVVSFVNSPAEKTSKVMLDIRSKVKYGGEAGLLGIAFHPDFQRNGYLFLNYIRKVDDSLRTVVARYQSDPKTLETKPESETIVLEFGQPYDNHNGGGLKFGKDGNLYISTGDGGSWGDPFNNGQNKKTLLGKILRIDINGRSHGHYSIPADNPFAGNTEGFSEEIYAYGLRNPWRISFDALTGDLWTGDVGQNQREEIDLIVKGGNYGWRLKESIACYKPPGRDCTLPGLIDPVLDLPQANGEKSITGGFVYRGKKWPSLRGKYIFSDYISGRVFALSYTRGKEAQNRILAERAGQIAAFGEDQNQELLLCDHGKGRILTLKRR